SSAVSRNIGGFSGGIPFDPALYREPMLLSTTDGVGTKILVARKLGKFDTIGIDLVAMNVNDLIVCGAEPMTFLDYIACGRIDEPVLEQVITGVVRGCEIAGCTLTGGETAEMPDVYGPNDLELAGFCTGIVEKSQMLPRVKEMQPGDLILGLPSSGIHSNGFSLARKALPETDRGAWRELLTPTTIYVDALKNLLATGRILGAAHITGGGLMGNFARVIPPQCGAIFSWSWNVPEIFSQIQRAGRIETDEMRRVFNMGVGIALVVARRDVDSVVSVAATHGTRLMEIGELTRG
ncbi:MAG TPA: phosphoribosylformylglycinamidine cyclo-ligase, partial [Spirochaetia bacterium]|nr:phosphoribosylformylglycinamidine cyclo-ligase [Spirochaetia bacterium]